MILSPKWRQNGSQKLLNMAPKFNLKPCSVPTRPWEWFSLKIGARGPSKNRFSYGLLSKITCSMISRISSDLFKNITQTPPKMGSKIYQTCARKVVQKQASIFTIFWTILASQNGARFAQKSVKKRKGAPMECQLAHFWPPDVTSRAQDSPRYPQRYNFGCILPKFWWNLKAFWSKKKSIASRSAWRYSGDK